MKRWIVRWSTPVPKEIEPRIKTALVEAKCAAEAEAILLFSLGDPEGAYHEIYPAHAERPRLIPGRVISKDLDTENGVIKGDWPDAT